jgi:predicted phosphodiesterase
MSLADSVDALTQAGATAEYERAARAAAPSGWEPGVQWNGDRGEVTTGPMAGPPADWARVLEVWNLDPNEVEVVEPVQFRAWDAQTADGVRRMFYYRASVRRRRASAASADELLAEVRKWKPAKRPAATGNGAAYVVAYADTQIGKPDGDGTQGTVHRVLHKTDAAVARLRELRKLGRAVDTVYLPQLGDCIEGFNSQGGRLAWRNELTLTEQVRVYRRLLLHIVKQFAPLADRVVVPVVPGNHDEAVRTGDKMSTRYDDSWAIEAASVVADVCLESPALAHVAFVFPGVDELTLTLDMAGTTVGLAHGHQTRGKAHDWWAKQGHGMQAIGDATLLLTGHYHHLRIEQAGVKTWVQSPALDGGSTWFRHSTGQDAPAGLVTLLVGAGGWTDLAVL